MKKYIFINYFSDPDPIRRAEYLYCVEQNVSRSFIDKVFIFVENEEAKHDIPPNDKIVYVSIEARMEFKDVINYTKDNLEDDAIIIILNLDVFIDGSDEWANVDKDFFEVGHPQKGLVCCRHNLDENMNTWIEDYSWGKGEFCDAWVLKTPLAPDFLKEDFNFCIGNAPQCDNTMMFLMSKYTHVFSWGSKYKIFHYDVCRRTNYKSGVFYNKTTDLRPSKRKSDHIDIPAQQDWDMLLKTGTKPKYLPTWRLYLLNFNVGVIPNV